MWLAVAVAFTMLVIVVELVRRQKLREEYAFLWIGTAVLLMCMALDERITRALCHLVGANSQQSVLFFGGLVFLMLVALQFSVRLTKLTFRNKVLGQRLALLERELTELRRPPAADRDPNDPPERIEPRSPDDEAVEPLPESAERVVPMPRPAARWAPAEPHR